METQRHRSFYLYIPICVCCTARRHSLNGSDYTSFEVRRWGKSGGKGQPLAARDATLLVQTTTLTQTGELCGAANVFLAPFCTQN
jgi:hypothetical protein